MATMTTIEVPVSLMVDIYDAEFRMQSLPDAEVLGSLIVQNFPRDQALAVARMLITSAKVIELIAEQAHAAEGDNRTEINA